MADQDRNRETGDNIILKTPPKMAFAMGILVGLTLMSATAFVMTYSLLRSEQGKTAKANTNTADVAGAATNQPSPSANTNQAAPTKVDIALAADDHVRGDKNAKVTLVEYSDFQCPYCGAVEPTLEKILTDYKGKVKLVYRHYPLSFHENAQKAAEASECANDQGKFWELHDKMYQNQTALTVDNLKQYAKDLKLNTSKFNTCLDNGTYAQKVKDEETQGTSYGVEGTPATFVNGTLVSGAVPYDSFKQVIDAALAAS
jgi:protein-disulfide isomerase